MRDEDDEGGDAESPAAAAASDDPPGDDRRTDETVGHASGDDRDRVSLADLLETIARGDRAAFSALYRATSGRLFAVALTMTRRRDVAEEVLQDAYLRVWHKARLYQRDRGQAIGWLVTIVRRTALDRLRQGQHDPLGAGVVEHNDEVSTGGEADLAEWLRGLGEDVRDCLRRLTANQQRAVLLAFYHGLTHEELADRLGVPLGTAKSWVRRGLERLKTCLDDGD
jgi:RNA polymerase sigma-70 factor (ECF subfamily)